MDPEEQDHQLGLQLSSHPHHASHLHYAGHVHTQLVLGSSSSREQATCSIRT
jgi:hypothetical protein